MNTSVVSNFKASGLTEAMLRTQAPSVYASGPMAGVSPRYTFVPTVSIVEGLQQNGWAPVLAEEQRIRNEARRGYQKHLLRFRLASQMQCLDEWNVELVLVNSHDKGCAYQLHAGVFRRICSNGLVVSETSFEAIRFRHTGLVAKEVVQASFRLTDYVPKVAALVGRFHSRAVTAAESLELARHALVLRYNDLDTAPVSPETLLTARRKEDEGSDLWRTMSRIGENLERGGVSDYHRDRRGKLRSVRSLRGIDSKISLNKGLWGLAEQLANGQELSLPDHGTKLN
jgi:hypothetical protein